ncbi:cytolysin (calcineurin-like family phosphatase) [Catalinimonas alkaloidigena]|uniref:hypothetical protein n=1 Tax=Catalinimonas alkaloidigena TaxID=1075417 RepID=UPI002404DFA2|nr:hypothetical protein [Catalinimonas alkaloidigena]MDF9796134.1 cytolysin (calcineurin-like family phosphatase) [Catalinimonas alkaloidigena]
MNVLAVKGMIMQSGKLSEELKAYVVKADSDALIPVLVTTHEEVTDKETLKQAGLIISRSISSIPLLMGKIQAAKLDDLAALAAVEKVELDSEISLEQG